MQLQIHNAESYLKDNTSEIEKSDITGQAVSDYVGSLPTSVDLSNTAYFPEIGSGSVSAEDALFILNDIVGKQE